MFMKMMKMSFTFSLTVLCTAGAAWCEEQKTIAIFDSAIKIKGFFRKRPYVDFERIYQNGLQAMNKETSNKSLRHDVEIPLFDIRYNILDFAKEKPAISQIFLNQSTIQSLKTWHTEKQKRDTSLTHELACAFKNCLSNINNKMSQEQQNDRKESCKNALAELSRFTFDSRLKNASDSYPKNTNNIDFFTDNVTKRILLTEKNNNPTNTPEVLAQIQKEIETCDTDLVKTELYFNDSSSENGYKGTKFDPGILTFD
jgi:hypothetical protein